MTLPCVWEHNGDDTLLYVESLPGAYTRGESFSAAASKMKREVDTYLRWSGQKPVAVAEIEIVQDQMSTLDIKDADSDVLFMQEQIPLSADEYQRLKKLALKSAADFYALYQAIPDKHASCLNARSTFYGQVPRTAEEMYQHTKNVNSYYFGEINVNADNEGTILICREKGLLLAEKQPELLNCTPIAGSYGELWTLRKVLRRFLWHDRIHAKAMYRMAVKTFGKGQIPNVFGFSEE